MTPPFVARTIPPVVARLQPVRRFARWALLCGFCVCMPLWLVSYADSVRQIVVVFVGFLGWAALGALGFGVKLVEFAATTRAPHAWRHVLPRWGAWLWLAAPLLHFATVAWSLDARIWFWRHRPRLDAALAAGPPVAGSSGQQLDDVVVRRLAPSLVLFRVGSGWEVRGVAFDPERALAAGESGPAGYLVRVADLGDGWRAWSQGD